MGTDLHSADGTRKWLLHFGERTSVEAVYIPDAEVDGGGGGGPPARGSMCLSSQCGCSLACTFCHTVRARPRRLSPLSVSHSKPGLCGAFAWVHEALTS